MDNGGREDGAVVVWEADGLAAGGGYGRPIAARLAERGIGARIVHLEHGPPAEADLASDHHVLSGGTTPVDADVAWLAAARDSLGRVLERAQRGQARVTGICFGAQLIAHMLAGPGAVRAHPLGLQAGLTSIVQDDGTTPRSAVVASFHHDHIDPHRITAAGGDVTHTSAATPVEGFRFGCGVTGVQFHPELDPDGLVAVLGHHRSVLDAHGLSLASLAATIRRSADDWEARAWDDHVPLARHLPAADAGLAA